MDKKSLIVSFIVLVLFISAIAYSYKTYEDVLINGITVQAKIISYNSGVKVKGNFQCQINYNGKYIELIGNSSINKGVLNYVGKTFPAKFSTKFEKLQLLITPEDFETFKMPFPDSLKWVVNLISNN